jgi:hypothetical protein
MAFADRVVRKGFMRKVFSVVALQLAVTIGFALMCLHVTPVKARAAGRAGGVGWGGRGRWERGGGGCTREST